MRVPADAGGGDDAEAEHDELYHDAVRLVIEFGKASTSLLQRRLRIGYGRAAHLIDLMETDGIVGAADGPKPREVLKKPDWLSEVEEALRYLPERSEGAHFVIWQFLRHAADLLHDNGPCVLQLLQIALQIPLRWLLIRFTPAVHGPFVRFQPCPT